jgi:hypothetical protein
MGCTWISERQAGIMFKRVIGEVFMGGVERTAHGE